MHYPYEGSGKAVRMSRLSGAGNGRYLMVRTADEGGASASAPVPGAGGGSGTGGRAGVAGSAVSPSVSAPALDVDGFLLAAHAAVDAGADALIVPKGRTRLLAPDLFGRCALVVHLSSGLPYDAHADARQVLVGGVTDALRLGADAVSVHVNFGSDGELAQLRDAAAVAEECRDWSMPLLVAAHARGPRIADPRSVETLSRVVTIAADLGADLVATSLPVPLYRMVEVVANSPVPVIAAGTPVGGVDLPGFARAVLATSCAGLAVDARALAGPLVGQAVRELAGVVHDPFIPDRPRLRHLVSVS
ncbi:class I fructose-bisphosphate aldolase [Yinghuangia seranimata]|uniref:class I fructose-bisphosphate aldolase n=1 Tax=Yinghuangia seranimata TaxID=408067 RepID=UPI00248ADF58|nr:fructose-bisphosphate aldolase [Yinghuangia seranimata]MDI2125859.1 fructose-bisphosphate aldolase [Yinghuangia seranimata]